MAPQQECLTNVDLLEIILSSVSINTLTTVRRVARPWREAVDDSPTNAEIQKKQFYTPIWVWRWVKRPPPSLIIIAGLSVASQWYAQVKERHYLLIDVHPAFDPFHDDPYSASSFGFATPLKYVLNMQNSSFERAFVTQPPVAEVQIPQTDMMPACFWNVKIVAEGGVRFGDIIKAIGPLAKDAMKKYHVEMNNGDMGGPLPEAVTNELWVSCIKLHLTCPGTIPSWFASSFTAVS